MSQASQIQVSNHAHIETITPLVAGGVFNGHVFDLGDHQTRHPADHMLVSSFLAYFLASHGSAADGAVIQQSRDAVTWFTVAEGTLVANRPLMLRAPVVAQFVRVALTNGATAQTALRIHSLRSVFP